MNSKAFLFMDKITIKKSKLEIRWTQISNSILNDSKLSLKAKGLYCILMSKPDTWVFYKSQLQSHFTDGKDSLNSAFDELTKRGLVVSENQERKGGKFGGKSYEIYQFPFDMIDFYEREEQGKGIYSSEWENPNNKNTSKWKIRNGSDSPMRKTNHGTDAEKPPLVNTDIIKTKSNREKELFKEDINSFLKYYNEIFKSKRRAVDEKLLKARLKKFTHLEIKQSILRASKQTYHIENGFIYLTPEYFVRNDQNIDKWLNAPEEKKEKKPMSLKQELEGNGRV